MPRRSRLAALLAVGCAGACTAPRVDPDWFAGAGALHDTADFAFPGATALLAGFDPPGGPARFAQGDEILFGVGLWRGRERQEWLVRLVVEEREVRTANGGRITVKRRFTLEQGGSTEQHAFSSPIMSMKVYGYRGDGTPIGEDMVWVPREFLRLGLFEACHRLYDHERRDPNAPLAPDTAERTLHAINALLAFLDIAQGSRQLAPILWRVVGRPSLWSVIGNLGVRVGIEPRLQQAVPEHARIGADDWPAFRTPLILSANDQPVLQCSLRVVQPHSPLNLGAGIVSMVGVRPGDPDTRVVLRVLAARRAATR